MSSKFITDNVVKEMVVVPLNTKVINIISDVDTEATTAMPLVEFQYLQNIENYLTQYDIFDDTNEDEDNSQALFSKTNNTLKRMSPGGQIVDIRIKLNSKQGIDPMLLTLWEKQKDRILKLQKILTTNSSSKLVDNIDMSVLSIGGHKLKAKEFDGALIEYYIKQPKPIMLGDKISNRFGIQVLN
jgi:hypothetical protein